MLKKGMLAASITCIFLGFFVIRGFDAYDSEIRIRGVTSALHVDILLDEINYLETQKQELLAEVREAETVINSFEQATIQYGQVGIETQEQLWNARVLAGLTDLQGSGIQIILNDRPRDSFTAGSEYDLSSYIVHDTDLLGVINELRSAGAEAIEINGVRILGNSRISCGGPTINVGRDDRFTPPFIINAIGDPEVLANYFQKPDSIYNMLVFYGLEFRISRMQNVKIPRHYGGIEFQNARPVEGDS